MKNLSVHRRWTIGVNKTLAKEFAAKKNMQICENLREPFIRENKKVPANRDPFLILTPVVYVEV